MTPTADQTELAALMQQIEKLALPPIDMPEDAGATEVAAAIAGQLDQVRQLVGARTDAVLEPIQEIVQNNSESPIQQMHALTRAGAKAFQWMLKNNQSTEFEKRNPSLVAAIKIVIAKGAAA